MRRLLAHSVEADAVAMLLRKVDGRKSEFDGGVQQRLMRLALRLDAFDADVPLQLSEGVGGRIGPQPVAPASTQSQKSAAGGRSQMQVLRDVPPPITRATG